MAKFDLVLKGKFVLENEVITGEVGVHEGKITYIGGDTQSIVGQQEMDFEEAFIFPRKVIQTIVRG